MQSVLKGVCSSRVVQCLSVSVCFFGWMRLYLSKIFCKMARNGAEKGEKGARGRHLRGAVERSFPPQNTPLPKKRSKRSLIIIRPKIVSNKLNRVRSGAFGNVWRTFSVLDGLWLRVNRTRGQCEAPRVAVSWKRGPCALDVPESIRRTRYLLAACL